MTRIQRLAWGTDAGFYRLIPEEVIHPSNETEVQKIIHRAQKEHKHITFRAAGTSLSGQAVSDSLLVVTGKKWEEYQILDGIDGTTAGRITLQPGIVGARVNEILKPYGRRFTPDPASIGSAMVGGIVNNNASGMCCGVKENSYRMLDSARIILADGTVLDTSDPDSRSCFERSHPEFIARIMEIREGIMADAVLKERILKKYSIKNVTGLNLLPLVEYEDPFDIISHLMVGSEGTLAFLSSVTMRTGHIRPFSASALVIYQAPENACDDIVRMKKSGLLSAAEFFDRKAMMTVEKDFPELKGHPENACSVLYRIDADSQEELDAKKTSLGITSFTSDSKQVSKWWAMRSGIFPAVGGTREIGTTCLIEDIAFPIEHLTEATADLKALFERHGYSDAVIYGHALDGNYHFILNQRFDTREAISQYDRMMHSVVDMVVDKYDGSLKAEHGTGRNMAPFVRKEWGDRAYEVMLEIKKLFDPENIFNPGVIFNEDPESYIKNIKPLPRVHPMIDRCIECGFCEVNCVSCGFALSSRQRIVISREISRLKEEGRMREAASLEKSFRKTGKDLCAGDGLCSTSCPVKINVGEYIHLLREESNGKVKTAFGHWTGEHLQAVGASVKGLMAVADTAHAILGSGIMTGIGKGLHKGSGGLVPLWTPAMPKPLSCRTSQKMKERAPKDAGKEKVVYFPSCINQRMGGTRDGKGSETVKDVLELLDKAGYEVIFPENLTSLCCGTIWESKGMPEEAERKVRQLSDALLKASEQGKWPVLCDQSPCLYRMKKHISGIRLYEPVEFIHYFILDRIRITPLDTCIAVHATCSTRKMGLTDILMSVAGKCAKEVILPEGVGCCAFAGDKGFTHPELNEWALRHLRGEIEKHGATMGFSNSRTCEIGLTTHSGITYCNIARLVNLASEKQQLKFHTCET